MRRSAGITGLMVLVLVLTWVVMATSCYAGFEVYRVSFNSQGGSVVPPIYVREGMLVDEPDQPAKDGYVFDGWYTDSGYTSAWDFWSDTVFQDVTLHASWEEAFWVSFDSAGGTAVEAVQVGWGKTVGKPAPPTRSGYEFDGWFSDLQCTSPWNFARDRVGSDMTLYAKWVGPYQVRFNSQGGSQVPAAEVWSGHPVEKPASPIQDGYVFDGWHTDSACTQAWNFSRDKVFDDMTLYAGWIKAVYVSFDSVGGTAVDAVGVAPGEIVHEPARPTRTGYVFDGWYADSGYSAAWDFSLAEVESNMTLYAKWIVLHTVVFEGNGGSGDAELEGILHRSTISAPAVPTREGYAFEGWYTETDLQHRWDFSTDVVAQDTRLYAKWFGPVALKELGPAGGYVFYDKGTYSDGWRYLEAAPVDTDWGAKAWGGYGITLGNTQTAIGSGKSNTEQIVARFGEAEPYDDRRDYAAKLCIDLEVTVDATVYDDWFLPSKDELYEMYVVLDQSGLGGFTGPYYWTSSEYSGDHAWVYDFSMAEHGWDDKYADYVSRNVRAVRAF